MDFFQQDKLRTIAKKKMLKEDCRVFSKLFISCQNRECDLHDFFHHENQSSLASLSDGGRLHVCQKSQLATVLEGKVTLPDAEPVTDAIIIDGSALVSTLPPRTSKTFAEYAEMEFISKVDACARKYHRTDIVLDTYQASSLKSETRSKRGQGARRRVTGTGKLPRNWCDFLRHSANKAELLDYLAEKVVEHHSDNRFIVTKGPDALSNHPEYSPSEISPCITKKPTQESSYKSKMQ